MHAGGSTIPFSIFNGSRDERGAHTRLDDILDGQTRNVIANNNLVEIIRSTNRKFEASAEIGGFPGFGGQCSH